jgi:hypothetical protein
MIAGRLKVQPMNIATQRVGAADDNHTITYSHMPAEGRIIGHDHMIPD